MSKAKNIFNNAYASLNLVVNVEGVNTCPCNSMVFISLQSVEIAL